MSQQPNYLVSMDLGNSATRVLVAELRDSNGHARQMRFRGMGEVPSQGWRKGTIADLGLVADSVRQAVAQAEAQAGAPVESAVVGIGGPHVQGLSSWAGLNLFLRPREVTHDDIRRVMEAARDVPLARDREILHMVPEEFVLDSQEGIRDPLGLHGCRLAVKVHIMSGSITAAQNVVTAVNRAGVLVETLVQEVFAVGEAALGPEERELGALVVALGSGSCEMVAYHRGTLRMSAMVPIGGDHFTNDVAVGLHVAHADAEIIKKTFGSVSLAGSHDGASFELPGLGNRPPRLMPQRVLLEILEPRAQELLGFALEEARRCGIEQQLGAGVILSGGGALLHGMCDLAERFFAAPARLGLPPKIADLPESLDSAEYATVLSLLLYGHRLRRLRAAPQRTVGRHWKNLLTGRK